jgi:hypothetical protein
MSAVGSGLGTGGLIVFDDRRDLLDVGRAVARFLAIESCGQCEPCKLDGMAITAALDDIVGGRANAATPADLRRYVGTVARGARCALARQQEAVIGDLLVRCGPELTDDLQRRDAVDDDVHRDPVLIAPLVDLVEGRFVLDERFVTKQPDWSHDEVDSGKFPIDRLGRDLDEVEVEVAQREEPSAERRDPVDTILEMHAAVRTALDAVLCCADDEFKHAASQLESALAVQIDVCDRILYPWVRRVTGEGDDAIWSAELHALDALRISAELQPARDHGPDRRRLDRLANDIRRHLADNERVILPLLRRHLDADEQTDLANALDEALAVSEPR